MNPNEIDLNNSNYLSDNDDFNVFNLNVGSGLKKIKCSDISNKKFNSNEKYKIKDIEFPNNLKTDVDAIYKIPNDNILNITNSIKKIISNKSSHKNDNVKLNNDEINKHFKDNYNLSKKSFKNIFTSPTKLTNTSKKNKDAFENIYNIDNYIDSSKKNNVKENNLDKSIDKLDIDKRKSTLNMFIAKFDIKNDCDKYIKKVDIYNTVINNNIIKAIEGIINAIKDKKQKKLTSLINVLNDLKLDDYSFNLGDYPEESSTINRIKLLIDCLIKAINHNDFLFLNEEISIISYVYFITCNNMLHQCLNNSANVILKRVDFVYKRILIIVKSYENIINSTKISIYKNYKNTYLNYIKFLRDVSKSSLISENDDNNIPYEKLVNNITLSMLNKISNNSLDKYKLTINNNYYIRNVLCFERVEEILNSKKNKYNLNKNSKKPSKSINYIKNCKMFKQLSRNVSNNTDIFN